MTACPRCGGPLETPLGCPACGPLPVADASRDPFAVFGLAPAYALDEAALRKRLVRFSRLLHPDFFGGAAEEVRALAEQNSAELNAAFDVLSSDYQRADFFVRRLGGPDQDAEREMPKAFLMEVLEWNETLEAARESKPGTPARAALSELTDALERERERSMQSIAGLLTPLPEPGSGRLREVRRALNAVRYVDRTLETVAALRLEQARQT